MQRFVLLRKVKVCVPEFIRVWEVIRSNISTKRQYPRALYNVYQPIYPTARLVLHLPPKFHDIYVMHLKKCLYITQ